MRQYLCTFLLAVCAATVNISMPLPAHAQSEASVALSMLPVASVVGAASVTGAAVSTVAAVPVALSIGGATLTVVAVEASVDGTVYVLERVSDGARASVKVLDRAARSASVAIGSAVTVTVIASGVVISAAGEVLAFVPNALGRALLYNEKLS
ncbi:hypothetical protein [Variovorax sp. YR216]|uniref:hypothetical protein n=1 Tax=Variovorax sp. YR216 TaxID=1882828 RepID=UPI00089CBA67|nr:hypothetical protein [Variovorax sp. YR216]SEA69306.1 hypothetical protein SAMN05444680_103150 [Variovorax sp. YR216]